MTFADADELLVELNIFSGRPNPRWTLAGEPLAEIVRRVRMGTTTEANPPTHLGYRGFVLRAGDEQAIVFGGTIHVRTADAIEVRRDDAGLEELLLAQARDHGYGDVIETMR